HLRCSAYCEVSEHAEGDDRRSAECVRCDGAAALVGWCWCRREIELVQSRTEARLDAPKLLSLARDDFDIDGATIVRLDANDVRSGIERKRSAWAVVGDAVDRDGRVREIAAALVEGRDDDRRHARIDLREPIEAILSNRGWAYVATARFELGARRV